MGAVAREAGTVVSAVMLGAIAGSGLFPFAREAYERVVRGGDPARREAATARQPARLRGGVRRRERAARAAPRWSMPRPLDDGGAATEARRRRVTAAAAPSTAQFPAAVHDMLALGHARMLDYQDAGYADALRRAPGRVLAAERAADPRGGARLRDHARDGALARAVDGLRRHRARRRPQEPRQPRCAARAQRGQGRRRRPARVYDHFKPGVARVRGAAAAAPGRRAACAGTAAGRARPRAAGRCR